MARVGPGTQTAAQGPRKGNTPTPCEMQEGTQETEQEPNCHLPERASQVPGTSHPHLPGPAGRQHGTAQTETMTQG